MMVFCRSIISHHNSFALSKMDRLMRGREGKGIHGRCLTVWRCHVEPHDLWVCGGAEGSHCSLSQWGNHVRFWRKRYSVDDEGLRVVDTLGA